MLLAIDIGNTETTAGLFDGDQLCAHWRLTTSSARTADEMRVLLLQLVRAEGIDAKRVSGVAICSVVPPVTQSVVDACDVAFGVTPVVVDTHSALPITLDVDEPATVGADRVINTLAASMLFGRDCIVVDMGTATTYDCVSAGGSFFGGVIQPGVQTSAWTLFSKTAMLPSTALGTPPHAIGTNTADCIRAGVVFGAADSIDGLIRRIKAEWPHPAVPHVVATGGLAESFRSFCSGFDSVDPSLTLKGLRLAHGILSNE
ncbi:MAG: type III pantothenate kinase [Gemmatimonadota bacterium]|nr:type III pantothenate kinase [Gemmatimonadota bacterium]